MGLSLQTDTIDKLRDIYFLMMRSWLSLTHFHLRTLSNSQGQWGGEDLFGEKTKQTGTLVCEYVLKYKILPGRTFDKREVALGLEGGGNLIIAQIIQLDLQGIQKQFTQ